MSYMMAGGSERDQLTEAVSTSTLKLQVIRSPDSFTLIGDKYAFALKILIAVLNLNSQGRKRVKNSKRHFLWYLFVHFSGINPYIHLLEYM